MGNKLEQVFESSFWKEAWGEAQALRGEQKKKNEQSGGARPWDKRAEHFDHKVSSGEGSARTENVISFLEDEGALFPGMNIIDIGCGPGSITLRLAETAAHIYALDPSQKMLQLLKQKIEENGLKNITLVQERWQDIDLEKEGWLEAFDLAFSSMSPGVDTPPDMQKLLDASQKFCYFSTFAGRQDRARQELWEMLMGKKFEEKSLDIMYPFNLLYTWGYRPSLRFHSQSQREYLAPEEAVQELKQFFHMALEVDEKVEGVIRNYIDQRLQADKFLHETEACHGMMLWDKNVLITR